MSTATSCWKKRKKRSSSSRTGTDGSMSFRLFLAAAAQGDLERRESVGGRSRSCGTAHKHEANQFDNGGNCMPAECGCPTVRQSTLSPL